MFYPSYKLIVTAANNFNAAKPFEGPEESSFATAPPVNQTKISDGQTEPIYHTFADGTKGIAKHDGGSHTMEPMAYHLGKKLGVNIPTTVLRQYPDNTGKVHNFSIQKRVLGRPLTDLNTNEQRAEAMSHPDFHKQSIFDYLVGNDDRHHGNTMYESPKNGQPAKIHTIDNGAAFEYHRIGPTWKQTPEGHITLPADYSNTEANFKDGGLHHPIPEDFRQAVLAANPAEHSGIIHQFVNHPNFPKAVKDTRRLIAGDGGPTNAYYNRMAPEDIKEYIKNHYEKRLNTLKAHFSDPNVKTMGDLHSRLFHKPE
jgi:hypothetical protein